jgi:carbamate kinase
MGPKIQAAIDFVQNSITKGRDKQKIWAAIGDLRDAAKIISNEEGTIIREDETIHQTGGVIWRASREGDPTIIRKSSEPHKSG